MYGVPGWLSSTFPENIPEGEKGADMSARVLQAHTLDGWING